MIGMEKIGDDGATDAADIVGCPTLHGKNRSVLPWQKIDAFSLSPLSQSKHGIASENRRWTDGRMIHASDNRLPLSFSLSLFCAAARGGGHLPDLPGVALRHRASRCL